MDPETIDPQTATDEEIAAALAELTGRVKGGEAAKTLRANLIRRAHRVRPHRWTQPALAKAAGVSQPAVSKILARTPGQDDLASVTEPAYVIGRILGIAERMQVPLGRPTPAYRITQKMLAGDWPITPETVAQARKLIAKDMRYLASKRCPAADFAAALADCDQRLGSFQTLILDTQTGVDLWLGHDHQLASLIRDHAEKKAAKQEREAAMITWSDLCDQITASLADQADGIDVEAIASAIRDQYGLVGIDTIDSDDYWAIVRRFDATQQD